MSVKSYSRTHAGPYFRFKADPQQIATFLFDGAVPVTEVDMKVGDRSVLPSGVVMVKRSDDEYNLYGHSSKTADYAEHEDVMINIPVDLIEAVDIILDNNLCISWEFIHE